jgi:hypothetical protein
MGHPPALMQVNGARSPGATAARGRVTHCQLATSGYFRTISSRYRKFAEFGADFVNLCEKVIDL